jgi:hypothetical protein
MTSLLFQHEAAKIKIKAISFTIRSKSIHILVMAYSLIWHVIIEFETGCSGLVVSQKSASGKAKTRPNPRVSADFKFKHHCDLSHPWVQDPCM